MPYDLYGTYYKSEIDAINAEMAQCAQIDARLAYNKVGEENNNLQVQQQYIEFLMGKVEELEERIKVLEAKEN